MTRLEAWLVHAANLLVGGSGLAYAWMLYALEPADELAVVNHPAQPFVQHAHVWTAPLLVFALGLIWRSHAWSCTRRGVGSRRGSGVALLATAAPMVLSGYFLQTAVAPAWRALWLALHLAASALWVAGTLIHQLTPRPRNGLARPASGSG
jgi:hypothetical protein